MNISSLYPFAPENLVSRDGFGSPVPRQPAHFHTQAESGAYLRNSSRVPRRRPFVHLNHHTPSGQSSILTTKKLQQPWIKSGGQKIRKSSIITVEFSSLFQRGDAFHVVIYSGRVYLLQSVIYRVFDDTVCSTLSSPWDIQFTPNL